MTPLDFAAGPELPIPGNIGPLFQGSFPELRRRLNAEEDVFETRQRINQEKYWEAKKC